MYKNAASLETEPSLEIGAEYLRSFNASIDSLSEIPLFVEQGPAYVAILGGIDCVKVTETNTDASSLENAKVTHGWNFYSTAESFGLNYTAFTWHTSSTSRSTLTITFDWVHEAVESFEWATCAAERDHDMLVCFAEDKIHWQGISVGPVVDIPFVMNQFIYLLIRAVNIQTKTGFYWTKEYVSSGDYFTGPASINAMRMPMHTGSGYDYVLNVSGADTPLVRCHLEDLAPQLSSTWGTGETTFVHRVDILQNATDPVTGLSTFSCEGVYFTGYDYRRLRQPADRNIPWVVNTTVGHAEVTVFIDKPTPPPPPVPFPPLAPQPPSPPPLPPPPSSPQGITNFAASGVFTWNERYVKATFSTDVPKWTIDLVTYAGEKVEGFVSDEAVSQWPGSNTVVFDISSVVLFDDVGADPSPNTHFVVIQARLENGLFYKDAQTLPIVIAVSPPASPPPLPPNFVYDGPLECVDDPAHVGQCGYTVFMHDTKHVSWLEGLDQPGIFLYVFKETGDDLSHGRVPFAYRFSVDSNSSFPDEYTKVPYPGNGFYGPETIVNSTARGLHTYYFEIMELDQSGNPWAKVPVVEPFVLYDQSDKIWRIDLQDDRESCHPVGLRSSCGSS